MRLSDCLINVRHVFVIFTVIYSAASTLIYSYQRLGKDALLYTEQSSLNPEQAVQQAYQYRSSLDAYEHQIQSLRLEERVALSGLLPQINVENYFSTGTFGTVGKHEACLEIVQQLINFGGPLYEHSVARQRTIASEYQALLHADNIRSNVEQSMLEVWRLQRKKQYVDATVTASGKRFIQQAHRGGVGDLDMPAVGQVQAEYKRVMASAANYLSDKRKAGSDLERSMEVGGNIDPIAMNDFVEKSLGLATSYSMGFYLDQAFHNRKELFIKNEQIIEKEYQESLFARSYIPSVSFYVRMNHSAAAGLFQDVSTIPTVTRIASTTNCAGQTVCDSDDLFTDDEVTTVVAVPPAELAVNTIWRLGIRLDWQFDGFAAIHQTMATDYLLHKDFAERRDLMRIIKNEVEVEYEQLQQKLNDLDASLEAFDAAERIYNKHSAEFQAGLITDIDMAEAVRDFEKAQFDKEEAQIKIADSHRELLARCGYPDIVDKKDFSS